MRHLQSLTPLRLMGDLCYSVYLGQGLALTMVMSLSTTPFAARLGLDGLRVLAVVLALGIDWLLYRCIEASCRTVLRRAPDPLRRLAARA